MMTETTDFLLWSCQKYLLESLYVFKEEIKMLSCIMNCLARLYFGYRNISFHFLGFYLCQSCFTKIMLHFVEIIPE